MSPILREIEILKRANPILWKAKLSEIIASSADKEIAEFAEVVRRSILTQNSARAMPSPDVTAAAERLVKRAMGQQTTI